MSLLLVAFLPVSLGCLNHYIESTKDSLDTIDTAAATTTTTEEDSSDSDSTTTTSTSSSIETKEVHYVDTEHYTVTTDLEVWNYRR